MNQLQNRNLSHRMFLFILGLFLCLTVTGCAQASYTIEKDGTVYSIDPQNGNLSDGTTFCTYISTSLPEGTEIKVIFPNGSYYWWIIPVDGTSENGHGGWSADYDETVYGKGATWIQALETKPEQTSSNRSIIAILLLIAVGLFMIASPESAANMRIVGKRRNVSAFTLHLYRSIGVLAVAAGIYFWIR